MPSFLYMKGDGVVMSAFGVERRVLRRPLALRAVDLRREAVFVAAFLRRVLRFAAFLAVLFLAVRRRLRVLFLAVRFLLAFRAPLRFVAAFFRPLRFAVLFLAAFLRVRFLAATMVLLTSSPSGGFGLLWLLPVNAFYFQFRASKIENHAHGQT